MQPVTATDSLRPMLSYLKRAFPEAIDIAFTWREDGSDHWCAQRDEHPQSVPSAHFYLTISVLMPDRKVTTFTPHQLSQLGKLAAPLGLHKPSTTARQNEIQFRPKLPAAESLAIDLACIFGSERPFKKLPAYYQKEKPEDIRKAVAIFQRSLTPYRGIYEPADFAKAKVIATAVLALAHAPTERVKKEVLDRRLTELESGKVKGIPAHKLMAKLNRLAKAKSGSYPSSKK